MAQETTRSADIETSGEMAGWERLVQADPIDELRAVQLELVQKGRAIFDLSMLNPDIAPPRVLLDKLLEAGFKPHNHRYAVSRGIRKLREAFAAKYSGRFGVNLDPETQVCATMGTKDALVHGLMALHEPSAAILLPAPVYPAHFAAAVLAGFRVSFFDLKHDEAAMLSEIEKAMAEHRPRVLLLNFPNNPTGICVSDVFYEKLGEIAARHDVSCINDFVYGEMGLWGTKPTSILSADTLRGRSAETYSLSKAYSVPGWRVGAFLGCSDMVSRVAKLKSHIDYGIFLPVQIAASYALGSGADLTGSLVSEYEGRAKIMVQGLKRAGFHVDMPSAGASVWAEMPEQVLRHLKGPGHLSVEFARRLLEEEGVLAMPGVMFGDRYDRFIRVALVSAPVVLREVLSRIESFCQRLGGKNR